MNPKYKKTRPTTDPSPGVLVIDVETTVVGGSPRRQDGAEIYALGFLNTVYDYGANGNLNLIHTRVPSRDRENGTAFRSETKIVVGHNIKFDLEHLTAEYIGGVQITQPLNCGKKLPFIDYVRRHCVVWDTQFLTYLASGHSMKFPSLEESCIYWGVPMKKPLDIGVELEKVGMDISKVPNLEEYLASDVDMTHELYLAQTKSPWVMDNISWILAMMQGLLGTFEIEHNGMHVDEQRLEELSCAALAKVTTAHNEMNRMVDGFCGQGVATHYNPNSIKDLSTIIFGGTFKYTDRIPNGVFMTGAKMGQPRFTLKKGEVEITPPFEGVKVRGSLDDDALEEIASLSGIYGWRSEFCATLRDYREYKKLYGTYLEGLKKHVRRDPLAHTSVVYPNVNLCLTDTGRTSSSNPNMQNNPTHDALGVRSVYISRYGDKGCFVEADFKQIEVIALAILSQDPVLIDDIQSGRDIHGETGKVVFGHSMTKEERRIVKTINFGLIYGGQAATLAVQAGVTEAVAKRVIAAFYKRYSGVKVYFEKFYKGCQCHMDLKGTATGNYNAGGVMEKRFEWLSLTGRKYSFKDYWNEKRKETGVSYTQTRNYPIQGLATGDLMLAALGRVCRHLLYRDFPRVKLMGLIHDSVVFDLPLDESESFMVELKKVLEDSGAYLTKVCPNLTWDLPVKVEFSRGPNLNEMTPYDLNTVY